MSLQNGTSTGLGGLSSMDDLFPLNADFPCFFSNEKYNSSSASLASSCEKRFGRSFFLPNSPSPSLSFTWEPSKCLSAFDKDSCRSKGLGGNSIGLDMAVSSSFLDSECGAGGAPSLLNAGSFIRKKSNLRTDVG